MKNSYRILLLLLISETLLATPTGAELLNACETSMEEGFQGITGMMCVWYVTPCDCHHGKSADIPHVCLPDGLETEYLAQQVVSGLKSKPELQVKTAEVAVGEILVKMYSCDSSAQANSRQE